MKKILIADDSEYVQAKLKGYITDKYEIVTAGSGVEARTQFDKENPDLTILDIVMPEGEEEGVNVLRDIKSKAPKANIVIMSAIGAERVISDCKKLGAMDYIEKPVEKQQVLDIVAKYLG